MIGPDTTATEVLNQMLFGGFRDVPVIDGKAVGMVSMGDLAKSIAKE
jgi:CBS domain-containing protein